MFSDDTFLNVTTNGSRMAAISGARGPDKYDNYTVYLWDDGVAHKVYSFHIANAGAIADDWCYNAHGGVYTSEFTTHREATEETP